MTKFKKAIRSEQKIKLAIMGASGSGKTWSSLMLAKEMGAKKIAVLDSEKSASLYGSDFDFDVCELDTNLRGSNYIKEFETSLQDAIEAGYDFIIIDSLSHLWDACLEYQSVLGGAYTDWKKVTPKFNKIIQTIVAAPCHMIITMRSKTEVKLEEYTATDGKIKSKPVVYGLTSRMRDGIDYEFTIVFRLNREHQFNTDKDRTNLFDFAKEEPQPMDKSIAKKILNWLNTAQPKEEPDKEEKPITPSVPQERVTSLGIKEQAQTFAEIISSLEDYSDLGEVITALEVWLKDNEVPEVTAQFLMNLAKEKTIELEPKF